MINVCRAKPVRGTAVQRTGGAKLIPALFILCLVSSPAFAEFDFGLPTDNSDVLSAFYTDTLTHLTLMNRAYYALSIGGYDLSNSNSHVFMGTWAGYYSFYPNSIPFYANAYWRLGDYDNPEGSIYSASAGSYIRLGDHFSLPLYAYIAGGKTAKWEEPGTYSLDRHSYNGLFTGSGLVFSSFIGTIGAYGGYYHYWGDEDLKPAKQENAMFEHFRFGLVPVLSTYRIPLLRYILGYVRNYFAFDFAEDKLYLSSYEVKGYTRRIPLMDGGFIIESLYYGYGEKQLTPALKQQAHTIGASATMFDGFFSVEAQVTGEKLSESISGWYTYYEDFQSGGFGRLSWSFDIFAGIKLGPFITGLILESGGRKGNSFGFVFCLPIEKHGDPSDIGRFYFNYGEESGFDLAGSFRQYHRYDD